MLYDIRANEIIPEQIRNYENGSGEIKTYSGGMDSTSYLDDTYYTAAQAITKNNFVGLDAAGELIYAEWGATPAIGFILDTCRENDTIKVYNKCIVAPDITNNGLLENPHFQEITKDKQYFLWANITSSEVSTGGSSSTFHWKPDCIYQTLGIGLENNRLYVDCGVPELMVE